jgi:hypothetical protein
MCIGRSTREATASAGYEAFVKQPSGVIERELGPFPPGAFRLDVAADIGDGVSWQLGVFVAHAQDAAGRLAEYHEDADAALWLTGEVANDLEVRPVGHLADKLHAARAELAALAAGGSPVTLIVPAANQDQLEQAELAPETAWVAVSRIDQALKAAGLPGLASPSGGARETGVALAPSPGAGAGGRGWIAAVAVFAIITAVTAYPVFVWLFDPELIADVASPSPAAVAKHEARPATAEIASPPLPAAPAAEPRPEIRLVIRERRAPPGETCASVQLGRIAAETVDVGRALSGRFAASRLDGLCGLEFTIVNAGAPAYVAAFTTLISGRFLGAGSAPEGVRGATPFAGEKSWVVDVARRLDGPIDYRLIAVVSDRPVAPSDRLRARADPVAAAREPSGAVVVHQARHRVEL